MKPSKAQIFFAKKWIWNVAFWACPLFIGLCFAVPFYSTHKGFISVILMGSFTGVIASLFVLRGLHYIVTKINGGPFHKGDTVHILVGEYKGCLGTIYEEWKDRNQVRVDLGEQAKKNIKDVFSFNEICRVKNNGLAVQ